MNQVLANTFAASLNEYNNNVCPCNSTQNSPYPVVPDFVEHGYFCDTGSENLWQYLFYGADPLWVVLNVVHTTPVELSTMVLEKHVFSDIEMRMCTDENC